MAMLNNQRVYCSKILGIITIHELANPVTTNQLVAGTPDFRF